MSVFKVQVKAAAYKLSANVKHCEFKMQQVMAATHSLKCQGQAPSAWIKCSKSHQSLTP
jgi:hypothetical protein